MPRFFSVHDPHIRATTPRARRDTDFVATALGKLEYVLSQASSRGVDAILIPGDLFHNFSPPIRIITKTIELLQQYQIEVIVCPGNHDFPGGRIDAYREETALGLLESAGAVRVLHAGKSWEFDGVVITGYGWEEPETRDLLDGLQTRPRQDTKFRISLVHAPYGGTEGKMEHNKLISTCRIKGHDINLFGDIHDDPFFEYEHRAGGWSYNPGALVRLTKSERDRQVRYLDITISKPQDATGMTADVFRQKAKVKKESKVVLHGALAWTFVVRELDVPMLPADLAFDVEAINEQVAEAAQNFEAAIAMSNKAKSESPKETLHRVGTEAGFSKEVIKMAIDHLDGDD